MTVVNYVLVGVLGTIVAVALYMAKVDISNSSQLRSAPFVTHVG